MDTHHHINSFLSTPLYSSHRFSLSYTLLLWVKTLIISLELTSIFFPCIVLFNFTQERNLIPFCGFHHLKEKNLTLIYLYSETYLHHNLIHLHFLPGIRFSVVKSLLGLKITPISLSRHNLDI